jgi:hypothetical protein
MAYPYIVQGSNITVVIGTTPHTISRSHITYNKVLEAIKANDWDTVGALVEPKQVVLNFGQGNVSIEGEKIFWKGREMHNALTKRMVAMIQEDFPVEPLIAFMENLMENPSKRAVNELYGFLEKNTLPITSDGCFLAYKKVRQDYLDCHSGTVLNKPAAYMTDEDTAALEEAVGKNNEVAVEVVDGVTVVSMERNLVDDDQNRTCSTGLHFCSQDYLRSFGGERIVILKINPRDVVSIPNDYNDSKGRCARYEIVDEIDKDKADEAFAKTVQEAAEKEASTLTPEKLVEALNQLIASQK